MELCFLNWVETGGKAHNGAPVKMNKNGGIGGPARCPDAESCTML